MNSIEFFPTLFFRTSLKPKKDFKDLCFDTDKVAEEALFLASQTLYYERKKKTLSPKEQQRVAVSLYKYKSRITNRATPFALFAGVGSASWGDHNSIVLNSDHSRTTKLDMNILCGISNYVAQNPELIPYLRFYPNRTIYRIAGQLRYVEYYYLSSHRSHRLTSVEVSEYLDTVLTFSEKGATLSELITHLISDEISYDEAKQFLLQLISEQILVSDFEPILTGSDYTEFLIEKLTELYAKSNHLQIYSILTTLIEIQKKLKQIDQSFGNKPETYLEIEKLLKTLNLPFNLKNTFQTDVTLNASSSTVSEAIKDKILNAINNLRQLFPDNGNKNLPDFRNQFSQRFGDQKVPIFHALDQELGIGYPTRDKSGVNPLTDDLQATQDLAIQKLVLDESHQFLLKKLLSRPDAYSTLEISSKEIAQINSPATALNDTFCAMFNIVDPDTNKIQLNYAGGASAALLLGRFGTINSTVNTLLHEVAQHETESNPEAILAEIVHLPENRTGNVLFRPAFRGYEIPYLAQSSLPETNQVFLADISICIRNNRIILWHEKLNKEIIPRLGNAHNYSFNVLPVYQFLCDLQNQDRTRIATFRWGDLRNIFKFLPRVEIDGTIVSRAQWNFTHLDLKDLKLADDEQFLSVLGEFRDQYKIPSNIIFVEADHELFIDLNLAEGIAAFRGIVRNNLDTGFTFKEDIFLDSKPAIADQEGNLHVHELLAVLKTNAKTHNTAAVTVPTLSVPLQRYFLPGSQWIYYKIYTGVKTSDRVLTDHINPLIQPLLETGMCQQWFFIRYQDETGPHLRVRLKISDKVSFATVTANLEELFVNLKNDGYVSNVCMDTYEREIERYGSSTMELSESIFYVDSKHTLEFLNNIYGEEGQHLRWHWALENLNNWLDLFKFDEIQKLEFSQKMSAYFNAEFKGDKRLKLQLDNKFRSKRSSITNILEKNEDYAKTYRFLYDILERRNLELKPIINTILDLSVQNKLDINLNSLLGSYIHMSLNRVFMGNPRLNEFVVYDMFNRFYLSKIAKEKRNLSPVFS